ncbi:hypothetical protein FKM82_025977 [Ascaphus truei]
MLSMNSSATSSEKSFIFWTRCWLLQAMDVSVSSSSCLLNMSPMPMALTVTSPPHSACRRSSGSRGSCRPSVMTTANTLALSRRVSLISVL